MKPNKSKLVAVSYDTAILNDLSCYLMADSITLDQITPDDFLKKESTGNNEFFINLVTKDFELRQRVSEKINNVGYQRFTFVHKSSCIEGADISDGVFVYPNVTVYPSASVSSDVIIQSNSRISHYASVGCGTFIGGLVNISGSSSIGNYCKIYPSTNIVDKISVADNTIIGTGTTIKKSIRKSGTYTKLSDKIKKIN